MIDGLKTVTVCPLGSKCTDIRMDKNLGENVVHRCMWYIKIQGTNPQNGDTIDRWDCAMNWVPILAIENTTATRSAAAAVESFRNEVKTDNQASLSLITMLAGLSSHQVSSDPKLVHQVNDVKTLSHD